MALSGGVDSTLVARAAYEVWKDAALAITADSPSVARRELADAKRMAEWIGIRHVILPTHEFAKDAYRRNDGSRCYHCKDELYSQMEVALPGLGLAVICSGANVDDSGDYRPGLRAAAEHAVRHPLQEAGFTKADVRALARAWDLPTWDKPASPCLSSRLAPGVQATVERTARVEAAEEYLHTLGIKECRVRIHPGELARLEVPLSEVALLAQPAIREQMVQQLRQLGFQYVTLDLEGFRSGSLNELVPLGLRKEYENPP